MVISTVRNNNSSNEGRSHHDAGQQTHPFPTVGVRDHVPISDGQEGDGDEPHGPQEGAGHLLGVMVPGREQLEMRQW